MHIGGVTSWVQNTIAFLTNLKRTHFYRENDCQPMRFWCFRLLDTYMFTCTLVEFIVLIFKHFQKTYVNASSVIFGETSGKCISMKVCTFEIVEKCFGTASLKDMFPVCCLLFFFNGIAMHTMNNTVYITEYKSWD